MTSYKVRIFRGNLYEVYHHETTYSSTTSGTINTTEVSDYIGTLSECESWIRLKIEGRFEE